MLITSNRLMLSKLCLMDAGPATSMTWSTPIPPVGSLASTPPVQGPAVANDVVRAKLYPKRDILRRTKPVAQGSHRLQHPECLLRQCRAVRIHSSARNARRAGVGGVASRA